MLPWISGNTPAAGVTDIAGLESCGRCLLQRDEIVCDTRIAASYTHLIATFVATCTRVRTVSRNTARTPKVRRAAWTPGAAAHVQGVAILFSRRQEREQRVLPVLREETLGGSLFLNWASFFLFLFRLEMQDRLLRVSQKSQ